jgi:hypothetical protein
VGGGKILSLNPLYAASVSFLLSLSFTPSSFGISYYINYLKYFVFSDCRCRRRRTGLVWLRIGTGGELL